ncbi:hypothetical protein [Frigidibacter oleivorans]|uniref:hypothetical protein n=1 Tax=Frigidibacter oleivorans TaxID=2487129 RepID=UPI000F8E070E|nr:hypothetical protein [Frigidibacter oleivorans]
MAVTRLNGLALAAAVITAAASGHLVQQRSQKGQQVEVAAITPTSIVPVAATLVAGMAEPDLAPGTLALPPLHFLPDDPPLPALPDSAAACTPGLDVAAVPGALIALRVSDRCRPGARIELTQPGLRVTQVLSAEGLWQGELPALTPDVALSVRFVEGDELLARVAVPDFTTTRRVTLAWQGDLPLELGAHVAGAVPGQPGHVSASRPVDAIGRLMRLGDSSAPMPALAQVFTAAADAGVIGLELVAAVTAASCGREIRADLLRDGTMQQIALAMPECGDMVADAGEFVLLPLPGLPAAGAAQLALAGDR